METKKLFEEIHENAVNKGFWNFNILNDAGTVQVFLGLKTKQRDLFDKFEKCPTFLALIHYRNNDLPNFKEEIADIVIRVFDLCAGIGMDWNELKKIIIDKHEFNKLRPPMHGKKC